MDFYEKCSKILLSFFRGHFYINSLSRPTLLGSLCFVFVIVKF